MNKKNTPSPQNVMYVKLSVHFKKFLESKYGKAPVSFPFSSPLYSCIERYIVNNYTLAPLSPLSYSAYAFHYGGGNTLFDNKNIATPTPGSKPEFVAVTIPERVYRIGSLIETSNNWQLSSLGVIEFKKFVRREFWMECIRFIDDCFHTARLQCVAVTRENAISDFMVAYNVPMSAYENLLRSERRARIDLRSEIETRRNWMESLNDTALTYT